MRRYDVYFRLLLALKKFVKVYTLQLLRILREHSSGLCGGTKMSTGRLLKSV